MTDAPPHTPKPPILARSVENLSTVLGVWHPSKRHRLIHANFSDALVPALILLLVQVLGYRVLQPHAALNIQVLQSFAGGTALALVAMALALMVLRQGVVLGQISVGVLWALVLGNLISIAALAGSDATSLVDWMIRRFGIVFVFALIFLVVRLGWRGLGAFAAFVFPTALIALPWFATLGAPPAVDDEVAFFDPDVEMIYAAQETLMDAQTSALRPGVENTPELFAVLGAGYPFEGVFRREVEAVGSLLSDRFAAKGRVISLINDDADQTSYPLMNRVNLQAALRTVAKAMNPEDIALVFLTSHGEPGALLTRFDQIISRDISAFDLNAALEEAGIGNAVIILPACYSGSFVDELRAPDRLILTGSDAQSVSFGCNDQNEWTEWGRAFFVDALSKTRDFRAAALLAQGNVTVREKEEGLPASSPQIVEGDRIGRILDDWLAEFD